MNGQDEAKLWYIDALDADAGIAFASFRPAEDGQEREYGNEHAVVVAAPHFQPSPVSHRALSLGAIGRGAQSGVYTANNEVGFTSLDQVVEFVRKVYVGGGAGGSAPSPDMPPVVPESPQGPEEYDLPPSDRMDATDEIHAVANSIGKWLVSDAAAEIPLSGSEHSEAGNAWLGSGSKLIVHTAVSIGCSLFERMPYDNATAEIRWRWCRAAYRLQQLLRRVETSRFYMNASMQHMLASTGMRLLNDERRWGWSRPQTESLEDMNRLARATYDLIIRGELESPFRELRLPFGRNRRYGNYEHEAHLDVFATLAALPMPGDVARPDGLAEDASVADFLAHCCATSELGSHEGTGLLVFSAFCLVSQTPSFQASSRYHFQLSRFQVTFHDAMLWLSKQFRSKLPPKLRHLVIGERPEIRPSENKT
jgi:hypothetical protein